MICVQRYAAYEFMFVVESDDRYTGEHWGNFFNAVLHIAQAALQDNNRSLETAKNLSALSKREEDQPDMILFAPGMYGPEAASPNNTMDDFEHWKFPNIIKHFTTLYGMSRRMQGHVAKHSRQGFGSYIEQFLPSVALNEQVNTVTISLGVWNAAHPLHCCASQISAVYDDWFLEGRCLASIPLHPVKNRKGFWKGYDRGIN